MNILKSIKDWLSDLVKAVGKQGNFTGSGVDTRYAADRTPPIAKLTANCLRYRKRAQTAEHKLRYATEALHEIVRRTRNNPAIDQTWAKAIHKIALDGYRAAKK